jgi:flotillin
MFAATMPTFVVPVVGGLIVLVVIATIVNRMWRVAEPNEALVTGKGTLVIPGLQVVRKLSLDLRQADLPVDCVTTQGIPVKVKGVVIFKVGDDFASIANAARRFLGQEDTMQDRVHNVFAGHLRSIVGGLTVEALIRDRTALTDATRNATGEEMQKLGLVVDSLQIQEIDDPTGYIENLAKPHIAEVQKDARIAEADNDREAAQAEQAAKALVAQAERDSSIKQAGFRAETEKADATAAQSGPLAEAEAHKAVVQQETEVAELEAARRERQLEVEVKKPADAEAYAAKVRAQGERDAAIAAAEATAKKTELVGNAEAERIAKVGRAEGDALKARADGLAANQDAVIAQQLAEQWPEIVAAAAQAFSQIDNLTVLDGAEGVSRALATILATGGATLSTARDALLQRTGPPSTNGSTAASEEVPHA